MSKKRDSQNNKPSGGGVVLFGRGKDGKMRAASFGTAHAKLAIKAAKALKFEVLPIEGDILPALADNLPAGRIHASGLGVVPPVRPRLYEQIAALTGSGGSLSDQSVVDGTSPTDGASPRAKKPQHRLPGDWHSIDVGDLVITEDEDKNGWWPAIVTDKSGDRFILRWHEFPRQRKFIRQRVNLGLLNPGTEAEEAKSNRSPVETGGSRYPSSWVEIAVGHLVLAQDDGPLGVWWPAVVVESADGQATLRWHDYEQVPAIVRERMSLALLHPRPD